MDLLLLSAFSYAGIISSFLSSFTVTLGFHFNAGSPFSSYGESYSLIAQDLIIILLIFVYGNRSIWGFVAILAVYAAAVAALLSGAVPGLQLLLLSSAPIGVLSRVPTIYEIFRSGSSGDNSLVMFLLNTGGALARIFTTLNTVAPEDMLFALSGFVLSSLCNGIITLQIIYYSFLASPKKQKNQ